MNGDYFTDCRRYHDYENLGIRYRTPRHFLIETHCKQKCVQLQKARVTFVFLHSHSPFISLFSSLFPIFSSPFLSHPTPRYLHTLSFIVRSDKYRCIPVLPIKCMAMIGIIALFSAWPDEMQNFLKAFQPGKIQSVL